MAMPHTRQKDQLSFDIFCQVIDNFGDIGVCWRLARQLKQRSYNVRLWVDDLTRFKVLEPSVNSTVAQQHIAGVQIIRWQADTPVPAPYDIVIEAFGCTLPPAFIDAMVVTDSLWINLEYLSAESWVHGFHLQRSVQANGLRKYFFFPGFTSETGGLLREPELLEQRRAWDTQPALRNTLLQSCGVPGADIEALNRGARLVFVFCYPDAPVQTLINSLALQSQQTVMLIPTEVYRHAVSPANNNVRIHHTPFVSQTDFDRLLWSADLNIVRGEDSLVRALWAARPMIWQPYPQDDSTHVLKLNAWLARSDLHADTRALIRSWTVGDLALFEHQLEHHLQTDTWARWVKQSQSWSNALAHQSDLVTSIVRFCTQHH